MVRRRRKKGRKWKGAFLLDDLSISGDFTIFPWKAVARIEQALRGMLPDDRSILNIIEGKYRTLSIQSPRIEPGHWAEAVSLTVKTVSAFLS